jgi:DNA end-binding protein Ku
MDDVLALHTMRVADELVSADSLEIPKPSRKPTKREIEMAGQLVDSMHERFDPGAFADSYRDRVLELIETKAAGKGLELPEIEEGQDQPDPLNALQASLGSSGKGASGKRPSADGSSRKRGPGRRRSKARS